MPAAKEILVVEDSRVHATILTRMLSGRGFHVDLATNGREALNRLQDTTPSLVLSDIEMPQMDGYELCRAIKTDPRLRQVPVILLTSLNHPEDIVHGLNAGADQYLTKPVELDALLSRVESLLKSGPAPAPSEEAVEVEIGGRRHRVTSGREQTLRLLLSTFETSVQQNANLMKANRELADSQARLLERNARLEQMNLQKNVWLGMAAHDMRNPLSIIIGYTNFLLQQPEELGPDAQQLMGVVESSARFMLQLIEDLLDVSTLESGKLNLSLEVHDLARLVGDAVSRNQPLARDKGTTLSLAAPGDAVNCRVDAAKIDQVLNNLLTNAIKYSPPNASVRVHVRPTEGRAIVRVTDEGPGIPPEEQSRLFLPFGRTSVQTTGGEKSTGLGLAIARRIVEGHSGSLGVDSEPGRGSTFWFSLPMAG